MEKLHGAAVSGGRFADGEGTGMAGSREPDEGILNRLISRILVGEVKRLAGRSFRKSKSFITLSGGYRR